MTCPGCERLDGIARGADEEFVATLAEAHVVLADEQLYRGYSILLLRDHVEHLGDLPLDRQQRLWDDVARVAAAVRSTVEPVRINYACLGNLLTHVHWHVIPRHADDPEPQHPIWVRPLSERRVALPGDERRALIARLRRALGA
jgi:diadenosine tetraphosphate (Ap4A) HIT family hydrolase